MYDKRIQITLSLNERQVLAVSCPSRCIKINDSYREIPVSTADPNPTVNLF